MRCLLANGTGEITLAAMCKPKSWARASGTTLFLGLA
jgi:hypothetical protein